MKTNGYSISVIMPAYNEEPGLEKAFRHTYESFQSLGFDFEIIIVDDHSEDRTADIARELAGAYPNAISLFHAKNQGIGGAFRTGISKATKEFVVFVPVDNPLDPDDILTYFKRMEVCDIVVGSRVERVGYTRVARFASFMYNRIMVPLLFNIGVSDVNWIQVYRRSLFTNGIISFANNKIFYLVEILVQAKKKQLIIAEVPARMRRRLYGKPTCSRPSTMFLTFLDMLKYFWLVNVRNQD